MKIKFTSFFILLFLFQMNSCSVTPTGRSQLKLMPDSQMTKMGDASYEELKKKVPESKEPKQISYVKCVTNALLNAMGERPSEWEIRIFKDESANAFALPGKHIGVHTGMLKIATDQAELAAVIGHEIAHVKAEHGNERVSQNLIVQGGLAAGAIALNNSDNKNASLILAGLGVGAQFGILLPFSRKHESEADILGMKYMASAGFNPKGAVALWEKMSKQGNSPAEWLSTHPNPKSRIAYLEKEAKKYQSAYQNVALKPACHL